MAVGASNSKRKESRAAHRSVRREQRREEPPELDPILTTALQRLVVSRRRNPCCIVGLCHLNFLLLSERVS